MASVSNIREFRLQLGHVTNTLVPQLASQFHRQICLRALDLVVKRTPVGNAEFWARPAPPGYVGGRARRNWQVSAGSPASGTIEGIDPSGSETFAAGAAVIATLPPYSLCWIANNLPYIEPLENGWSRRQAPNGMVAITLSQLEGSLA